MFKINSEALLCKKMMVENRELLGLESPSSEDLNAVLRDAHALATTFFNEYGIHLFGENAFSTYNFDQNA